MRRVFTRSRQWSSGLRALVDEVDEFAPVGDGRSCVDPGIGRSPSRLLVQQTLEPISASVLVCVRRGRVWLA